MNNIDKLEQAWYTLTDEKRWKRLPEIQQSNPSITVILDSNITYLIDENDDDFYLEFDNNVGSKDGTLSLLSAFNINAKQV